MLSRVAVVGDECHPHVHVIVRVVSEEDGWPLPQGRFARVAEGPTWGLTAGSVRECERDGEAGTWRELQSKNPIEST
jgi:hypothetical protein